MKHVILFLLLTLIGRDYAEAQSTNQQQLIKTLELISTTEEGCLQKVTPLISSNGIRYTLLPQDSDPFTIDIDQRTTVYEGASLAEGFKRRLILMTDEHSGHSIDSGIQAKRLIIEHDDHGFARMELSIEQVGPNGSIQVVYFKFC